MCILLRWSSYDSSDVVDYLSYKGGIIAVAVTFFIPFEVPS